MPDKPKHFHQHPENEIGFETHLANERVAQHDGVDVDVTAHDGACATNKEKPTADYPPPSRSTAGHSYTLTLISHDDNYVGDATYTLFDDVITQ